MTITAAVPAWITNSSAISDPVWEWIVYILCRCGKRCWCSVSTKSIAMALGRKEDTGTRIAREVIATGLVVRLCRPGSTVWIINTEGLAAGSICPGWQPSIELLTAIIADLSNRFAYRERSKALSLAQDRANHRRSCFYAENYGEEADLLDLARRQSQARFAFALAKIETERFMATHGVDVGTVGSLMLKDPAFAAGYRKHDGTELQCLHARQLMDADWNELECQAKEAVVLARKQLWEHRKAQPVSPDHLLRGPLAKGTYSVTPRGLMTREFQRDQRLRDASGVRRLLMLLLSLAKGARTYDTTIEAIAERMGRHRETISNALRVLHEAELIGLGYIVAREATRNLCYSHTESGVKVSLGDGISPSRIRGVRITLQNNQSRKTKSDLGSGWLGLTIYEQPKRQLPKTESGADYGEVASG